MKIHLRRALPVLAVAVALSGLAARPVQSAAAPLAPIDHAVTSDHSGADGDDGTRRDTTDGGGADGTDPQDGEVGPAAPVGTPPSETVATESEVVVPPPVVEATEDNGGLLIPLLLLIGGLALGGVLGFLGGRGRDPRSAPATRSAPQTGAAEAELATQRERRLLIDALMDLAPRLPSDVLRREVFDSMRAAGVSVVDGDGELFDPGRHEAVDLPVPTRDAALHNRIASTEEPGYVDRGEVLRVPKVLVYRLEEDATVEGVPGE